LAHLNEPLEFCALMAKAAGSSGAPITTFRGRDGRDSSRPKSMPIHFSSQLSVPADVMVRQIGDEAVLLNLKAEQYMGLDSVSNRVWQVLTAGTTVQHAYDLLLTEYEVDPARLRTDLEEFVQELLHYGLVEQKV
jgi:hypothetical protein